MKKNMGNRDRLIRFSLALALLFFAYFAKSWIVLAASLFVFYEAFAGWCLFYQILGKSTCPIKKNHH
jgi:hypothetical protein